jgi:hypothetical protein
MREVRNATAGPREWWGTRKKRDSNWIHGNGSNGNRAHNGISLHIGAPEKMDRGIWHRRQ